MTKEQKEFEQFIKSNYWVDGDTLLDKDSDGAYTNKSIREYWFVWRGAIKLQLK